MPSDNFLWFLAPAVGGNLTGGQAKPEGESTDKFFLTKKATELLTVQFGLNMAETTGSAGTGSGAGKVKFDEIQVEKYVDAASVPLYNACCAGAHFPTIMLANRKAGGSNLIYIQYVFRMVFVTNISWSGGGGDEMPKETVKFKFGAMGLQYCRQLPSGAPGVPIDACWSVLKNKPTLEVTELAGETPKYLNPTP